MTVTLAHFSTAEMKDVEHIVGRAAVLFEHRRERIDIMMDLAAVHESCPLRLGELSRASDGDFAHDLGGIAHHLDRTNGELQDCFLPRYAARSG